MLTVLGLVFVIVSPIFIYRFAKQNGRNAIGWALLALGVGFGIQFIIPVLIGIAIALVMLASGSSPGEIQRSMMNYATYIDIGFLVLSVLGIMLIMRQVAKIPEVESYSAPPTPPEKFD